MAGGCSFCEIVAGTRPAAMVMEDEQALAFLDTRPLFPGHCLLIPRAHIETLGDLPAEGIADFFASVQLLARAVEEAFHAEGSFVAINNRVSQSVPHLHVHVVPRRKKDGLRGFFWPRGKYADEAEIEGVRASVAEAVRRLREAGGER
jgi:histidine triad (HIT) family protein